MVDICSLYLKSHVTEKTVLDLYLISHAHNAQQLKNYCVRYIAMRASDVVASKRFRAFKRSLSHGLFASFTKDVEDEKRRNFVEIQMKLVEKRIIRHNAAMKKGDYNVVRHNSMNEVN